jgi:hypothetical protein
MEQTMGLVVQLSEKSIDSNETSANVIDSNIVQLPFGEARDRIAQAESTCEILRQSIGAMRRSLRMLEGIAHTGEGDHAVRRMETT